jgi:hypothetical protein
MTDPGGDKIARDLLDGAAAVHLATEVDRTRSSQGDRDSGSNVRVGRGRQAFGLGIGIRTRRDDPALHVANLTRPQRKHKVQPLVALADQDSVGIRPGVSKWKRSEVTYGPVGRVVATVVVLLPVLGAVFSVFFLIASLLWLFGIVPMALRGIWRRVRDDEAPATLELGPDLSVPPGETINDRVGPARW